MQPVLLNKAAVSSGDPHQLIGISLERDSWEINPDNVGERNDKNSTTLNYAYCSPIGVDHFGENLDKYVIRRPCVQTSSEQDIDAIQQQLHTALEAYMQDKQHRKFKCLPENVLKETAAFLHSRTSEASELLSDALRSYWVRWGTG